MSIKNKLFLLKLPTKKKERRGRRGTQLPTLINSNRLYFLFDLIILYEPTQYFNESSNHSKCQ